MGEGKRERIDLPKSLRAGIRRDGTAPVSGDDDSVVTRAVDTTEMVHRSLPILNLIDRTPLPRRDPN